MQVYVFLELQTWKMSLSPLLEELTPTSQVQVQRRVLQAAHRLLVRNIRRCPDWVAWLVGVSSQTSKGRVFNSRSRNVPGLQVPSLVRAHTAGNWQMFLSHWRFPPSLSLPPSLPKSINILRWAFFFKKCSGAQASLIRDLWQPAGGEWWVTWTGLWRQAHFHNLKCQWPPWPQPRVNRSSRAGCAALQQRAHAYTETAPFSQNWAQSCHSNPVIAAQPEESETSPQETCTWMFIEASFIVAKLEAIKTSFCRWWVSTQRPAYPDNGPLFNPKKKWAAKPQKDTEGP